MSIQQGDKKVISKLVEDGRAFFFDGLSGNLWPYLYGAPNHENDPVRGGILYNEMLEGEKNYYLYECEAELYQKKGELIASLIGPDATFIEFGPGGEKSLRLKTLPLLRACSSLHGYVGIEIAQSFLDRVLEIITTELPGIVTQGIHQDFTQLDSLPDFDKPVVFFKGSTIANLRKEEVPPFISSIKELVGKDHYLILAHDTNQDEASLMEAYDNPGMAVIMENIMYRLNRDLDLNGMIPQAFSYRPEWEPATHDLKHVLTATQSQEFEFKGKKVQINENQKFHILSSFKYPVEVFQDMISSVGYTSIDVFLDSTHRLAAHVFQGSL